MKEFKINDFLTLKLEENTTNIYVNGELFMMCKYLMLNIPIKDNTKFDEIESLDEAADILGWSVDGQEGIYYDFDFEKHEGVEYDIDPETEFWGHCSNLQVWYENDYDTRLLHSNLSFPLLKVLNEAGDPVARRVFKKELAKRIESGYPTVIECIVKPNLSDYLNGEELKQLIEQNFLVILTAIEKLPYDSKLDVLYNLISLSKEAELLEIKFSVLLESIDKLPDEGKHHVFSQMMNLIEDTQVLNSNFLCFLEHVNLLSDQEKRFFFSDFIDSIKDTDALKKNFPAFLVSIDILSNEVKYEVVPHLIASIKNTKLFDRYSSQIDTQFLAMLKNIDKCSYDLLYKLFNVSKEIGWMEEHFLTYLEIINKLTESDIQYEFFSDLFNIAIKKGWLENYFTIFLEIIDRLPENMSYVFSDLFESAQEAGWFEDHFLAFLETIDKISDCNKLAAFDCLIESAQIAGSFEAHFPAFLNMSFTVFKTSSDAGWMEEQFQEYVKTIYKLNDEKKYSAFSALFKVIKNTHLLSKYSSLIKSLFLFLVDELKNIPVKRRKKAYSKLIEAIRGTYLKNALKKWKSKKF